jgi:putative nucleotidyltransferase with HDIG domain
MVERDQPDRIDERSLYAGRWIACIGGQIVGHGGTPRQARQAAQASRFKETPQITYVATKDPILVHPILKRLAAILPHDLPVYVVGGAVRNALTKRPTNEFDFTLPGKAIQNARRIADALDGAFYVLDKERDYGRVILPQPEGDPLILDFSPFQGANLEEDLRSRDFTINAIAFEITRPQELLDPLGGAADLYAKRLRICTPDALANDPVRILRGIRFSVSWEMRTEPGTQEQMRAAVGLLPQVSAERLRDELFSLLDTHKPFTAIRILDYLDASQYILPELDTLKGLEQSPPHTQDAWQHSLDVLNKLYTVLDILKPSYNPEGSASLFLGVISHRLGRYREQLANHLKTRLVQQRSLIALIFLAALYHDIGKPETQKIDQDGRIRYIGHEEVGADLAAKRGRLLQLSNTEIKRLKSIVLHHMRPLWLSQTGNLPSRRATYRFFRDTGSAGVDICLLSLADTLATYGPTLPTDLWANQVDVVRALLEAWWEKSEEVVSPPALIDGNDLIDELGFQPGPIIGQVLRTIQEAQATGKVTNRRQALELASGILENSDTDLES